MGSPTVEDLFADLQRSAVSTSCEVQPLRAPTLSNNAGRDKRNDAFRAALKTLSTPDNEGVLDEEGIADFVSFFDILYADPGYRHMYSDICEVMFGCLRTDGSLDEEAPVQALSLANNIEIIATAFERRKADSPAVKSVMKLKDHVQLEQTRIKYMVKQNEWRQASYREIEDMQQAAKVVVDNLEKRLEGATRENRDALDAAKRDYVTILGIFASIVIAFTAGSAYASSVLANINAVGIYRLVFIVLLIGLVLFNLVAVLLLFVLKVSDRDDDNMVRSTLRWGNALIGIAMAVVLVARYCQWV